MLFPYYISIKPFYNDVNFKYVFSKTKYKNKGRKVERRIWGVGKEAGRKYHCILRIVSSNHMESVKTNQALKLKINTFKGYK